jgi:phosphoribosylformylglycinamidine (FGAM) synthase-like amidotransferase family enzyme
MPVWRPTLDEALALFLATAPFLAHYPGGHALADALRCGLIQRLSQGTAVHEKLENLSRAETVCRELRGFPDAVAT